MLSLSSTGAELTDGMDTGIGSTSIRMTPEGSPSFIWWPVKSSPSTEKKTCRTNSCATLIGVSVLQKRAKNSIRQEISTKTRADLPFIGRRPGFRVVWQPLDTAANPKVLLHRTLHLRRRKLIHLADHAAPPYRRCILCRSFLVRNVALGADQKVSFRARNRRGFRVFERLDGVRLRQE